MIRTAILSDLSTLEGFRQGIVDAERPFDNTLKPDPIVYYDLEALILSPNAKVLVVEMNAQPVACGYAEIREAKDYLKHDFYAHIGCMFVQQEYRGKGLVKDLIQTLQEWAQTKGVLEIRLEVYAENEIACNAYKKIGFVPHILEMRLRL